MIERGEIRSYLPTVAGREKATALSGSRVLILSNNTANGLLPTVLTLPVIEDTSDIPPQMVSLAVLLGDLDSLPGAAVLVYRPLVIYRNWLTDRVGTVSQGTMRQVFAAMVNYIDE